MKKKKSHTCEGGHDAVAAPSKKRTKNHPHLALVSERGGATVVVVTQRLSCKKTTPISRLRVRLGGNRGAATAPSGKKKTKNRPLVLASERGWW
jgi:hypothetical protein